MTGGAAASRAGGSSGDLHRGGLWGSAGALRRAGKSPLRGPSLRHCGRSAFRCCRGCRHQPLRGETLLPAAWRQGPAQQSLGGSTSSLGGLLAKGGESMLTVSFCGSRGQNWSCTRQVKASCASARWSCSLCSALPGVTVLSMWKHLPTPGVSARSSGNAAGSGKGSVGNTVSLPPPRRRRIERRNAAGIGTTTASGTAVTAQRPLWLFRLRPGARPSACLWCLANVRDVYCSRLGKPVCVLGA